ncbi:O-antigen ligase family protein, partial [bacterium]|nr:O-antigen ligase family protein [bacterium]
MLGACFSCVVALKSFVDFFTGGAAAQVAVSAVDVTKARFAGHWVDPNYLSTSMVCYLAPSIAIWRSKLSWALRYFALATTVLISTIVIITISRTGMIAAFFVIVMMVAVQRRRLLLGVSLAALFLVLLSFTPIDVMGRLMNSSFDASSGERGKLLEAGWNMFLRDPVFGSGLGTLRINMTNEFPHNHTTISAHNNYLDMAAEAGLIGLGLLIALLIIIGKSFNWRDWAPADGDLFRGLNQALRASFIVVLLSFATFTTYLYAPYWMVFILASTLPFMERPADVRAIPSERG